MLFGSWSFIDVQPSLAEKFPLICWDQLITIAIYLHIISFIIILSSIIPFLYYTYKMKKYS